MNTIPCWYCLNQVSIKNRSAICSKCNVEYSLSVDSQKIYWIYIDLKGTYKNTFVQIDLDTRKCNLSFYNHRYDEETIIDLPINFALEHNIESLNQKMKTYILFS